MTNFCYINGRIVPVAQAKVSINDIGLLRGYAVFDFLRTYGGEPFLFNQHWQRFQRSAKLLDLKIPLDSTTTLRIINRLLLKNHLANANIRLVITGGDTINGLEFDKHNPTFFITATSLHTLADDLYRKGVKLLTFEHSREIPRAKTDNYITAVKMHQRCRKAGALEVLYTSQGRILEAATSNFFIIKNRKVITPRNDILIGITRNEVIRLAKQKFAVEERDIKLKELYTVDEAFITATNKEVLPVTRIDSSNIGDGKVGPITKQLIEIYRLRTHVGTK